MLLKITWQARAASTLLILILLPRPHVVAKLQHGKKIPQSITGLHLRISRSITLHLERIKPRLLPAPSDAESQLLPAGLAKKAHLGLGERRILMLAHP